LQKINAQHQLSANRRAAALSLGIMRLYQSAELLPRHNRIHLIKNLLTARLLDVNLIKKMATSD
jgi:hypothetical protein